VWPYTRVLARSKPPLNNSYLHDIGLRDHTVHPEAIRTGKGDSRGSSHNRRIELATVQYRLMQEI
jgi:hypothetical protein